MLDIEKWRVHLYVVPVPMREQLFRPKQLPPPVPAPLPNNVAVWGIWPPMWTLSEAPLLVFPPDSSGWRQAFRAAHDRAGFAAAPSPAIQPLHYFIDEQGRETPEYGPA